MNIVIDTNIFISAIFWDKIPLQVIDYIFKKGYKIYVTEEILTEYFRVIEKIAKSNIDLIERWKTTILINTHIIEPIIRTVICRDPKDNMFLECAYSCEAKYLISGDDDLLSIDSFKKTEIITPKEFLNIYS